MSRSRRLRVGFDARALRFPAGGVRRYAAELLRHLPEAAPEIEIVAIDAPTDAALPEAILRGPTAMAWPAWIPGNLARAAWSLPRAIAAARVDVFHAPAYTAPFVSRTPVVVSIHDVSYARRPEYYAHPAGRWRQWFYRRSAVRATRIITGSGFSRDEIVAAYGIDPARIAVVPDGVSETFGPSRAGDAPGAVPDGVRAPFVLHVGELHHRRDLATALEAVLRVRREGQRAGLPLQLVCAGVDRGVAAELRVAAAASGEPGVLVLTGPVSESILLTLYREAAAFVYPSRYEGFGLPVLEAMACGLPVVAAREASVPEVLGDAGILVTAGDVGGFAEALALMLDDRSQHARYAGLGRTRARQFSWERTARSTADVYHSACAAYPHRDKAPSAAAMS